MECQVGSESEQKGQSRPEQEPLQPESKPLELESLELERSQLRAILSRGGLTTIAPVVATSLAEVAPQWRAVAEAGADLVEWRLDLLPAEEQNLQVIEDLGRALRTKFGTPVLATWRTSDEGGGLNVSAPAEQSHYERAVKSVARWADMVDIEIGRPDADVLIVEVGHQALVVASFHDFQPPVDEALLKKQILRMTKSGAEVSKVAAIVADQTDLEKIHAVQDWAAALSAPTVVIGMGSVGKETRLGARATQNAFSFASVGESSAPGQPTLVELEQSCSEQNLPG